MIARIRGNRDKPIEEQLTDFVNSRESEKFIERTAKQMITCVQVESAKDWKEAATIGSRGMDIYLAIKNEMKGKIGAMCGEMAWTNANYIKTLPMEWARWVTAYTMREVMKGRRPEDVEKELRGIVPEHMAKNLKCIVRTEMAKANAALTQARAENLGINAYIWHAAMDERTRHAHAGMNGILVFYDDPPSPEALFPGDGQRAYGAYHAGNTFNCRCWQEPVVDWNFLPDTIRVHSGGSIKTMSRAAIIKKYAA